MDRGGTFTDLVALQPSGKLKVVKLLSQSKKYKDAVVEGIQQVMAKKSVVTAFVTTLGFSDILKIRQQNRPQLFNLNIQKTPHVYSLATEVLSSAPKIVFFSLWKKSEIPYSCIRI